MARRRLLYQKAANGEVDATLNFWNFCVALESRGFRRLIGMDEVERRLGAKGPVAMVGYVFDEGFAQSHAGAAGAVPQRSQPKPRRFSLTPTRIGRTSAGRSELPIRQSSPFTGKAISMAFRGGRSKRKPPTHGFSIVPLPRPAAADLTGPAKELDEEIYYKGSSSLAPRED